MSTLHMVSIILEDRVFAVQIFFRICIAAFMFIIIIICIASIHLRNSWSYIWPLWLPIILALCSWMFYNSRIIPIKIVTYYPQNYAGTLGSSLAHTYLANICMIWWFGILINNFLLLMCMFKYIIYMFYLQMTNFYTHYVLIMTTLCLKSCWSTNKLSLVLNIKLCLSYNITVFVMHVRIIPVHSRNKRI